jgi:hypothetical protein
MAAAARAQRVNFAKELDILEIVRVLKSDDVDPELVSVLRHSITQHLKPEKRIPIRILKANQCKPDGYMLV